MSAVPKAVQTGPGRSRAPTPAEIQARAEIAFAERAAQPLPTAPLAPR